MRLGSYRTAHFAGEGVGFERRTRANQKSSLKQLQLFLLLPLLVLVVVAVAGSSNSNSSDSTRSWMRQPHLARDGLSAKTQLAQSSIHSKKTFTSDTSEETPAPRLESPRKTTAASVVVYDKTSAVESDLDGGRRRQQMAARGG